MTNKRFNISLPTELVVELDIAAKADHMSRSAYVRRAIKQQLKINRYITEEFSDQSSLYNTIRTLNAAKALSKHAKKR